MATPEEEVLRCVAALRDWRADGRAPRSPSASKQARCLCLSDACIHPIKPPAHHHSRSFLEGMEMNEERYLGLLAQLIGEAEHLQNNPAQVIITFYS